MKLLNWVLFVIFTSISTSLFGQNTNIELPKIIRPSPEAANFMRYGEIPVDYSTGVPNISIPIYTLTSRKLSLPISLSYHASGIKVNDRASVVGLGWVLNAGGMVSRTILGKPDELPFKPTYKTAAGWTDARQALYTNNVSLGDRRVFGYTLAAQYESHDWMSDRFSYQLPGGKSGVFYYDYLTDEVVTVPYAAIKITKQQSNPGMYNNSITGLQIVDDDGSIYNFDMPETNYEAYNTSWVITSIISADKTDTISFSYKSQVNIHVNNSYVSVLDYGDSPQNQNHNSSLTFTYNYSLSGTGDQSISKVLESISSTSTTINLSSIGDRLDMDHQAFGQFRTNKLSIIDKSTASLLKEFNFNQSYFGTLVNNKRLRLDGITVKGNDLNDVENYSFNYESGEMQPYNHKVTDLSQRFAEDYWGYYNGKGSYTLLPKAIAPQVLAGANTPTIVPTPQMYLADRTPNYTAAKTWMLKEINYPTGGKSVFEFEPNTGGGGFRIKKITNFSTATEVAEEKNYEYEYGIFGPQISNILYAYTQRNFYITDGLMSNGSACPSVSRFATYRTTFTSSPLIPLAVENGPGTAFYQKVTEYSLEGKTVYTYQPPEQPSLYYTDEYRKHNALEQDMGNYIPQLLKKEIFKKQGAQYSLVKSEQTNYSSFKASWHNTGIHVLLETTYNSAMWFDYWDPQLENACTLTFSTFEAPSYFFFRDMKATQLSRLPTQTNVYEYDNAGVASLVATTNINYGSAFHLLPTEQISINSKQEVLKNELKYPTDFASTAPYSSMVAKNILTPVIEQQQFRGNALMNASRTNYQDWGNNIIAPLSVETKMLNGNYEQRLRFYGYDNKGNVLSVSKTNGPPTSYIWSYNQQLPIAKIDNADYTTVQTVLGQSTLNSLSALPNPTDAQVDAVLAAARTGPSLKNAMVTSYTYRPLIGAAIVTDAKGIKTYYEYDNFQRLKSVKDQNQHIVKANNYHYTGQAPEVFSGTYYNDAQSGTFVKDCGADYDPGLYNYEVAPGVYSSTVSKDDANAQALADIALNGQTQANANAICIPKYTNDEASSQFITNCSSGYLGTNVVYVVPAGKYRATSKAAANVLAANDIAANGQNYANTYGSCVVSGIYAKISYENETGLMVNNYYTSYRDVVVRFYQDPSCTIPASVTGLVVYGQKNSLNDTTSQETITSFSSAPITGQSAVLFPQALFSGALGNDYVMNYWYLTPGSGYIVQ